MLRIAALLIVAGLAAGCASSASEGWTKPGATKEQANKDSADCLFDAQTVRPGGPAGPMITVDQVQYRQCMANKGYSAGPSK
jgi:hypothetical protein